MPGLEKLTETLLALAPVAVGYFAGWAYLNAYLTAFQIDISEVSLPLATVLIYSYLTVGTGLFLMATLVLVCLAFIPKGRWNLVRLHLMAVGIWGYAWASVEIARSQAEARSYEVWQGAAPKKIAMVETRKGDTIAEEYNRCGRQRRLLSVFNTTELSYVLCRAGDRKPEAGMVYAVAPDGKIRSRRGAANEVSGNATIPCDDLAPSLRSALATAVSTPSRVGTVFSPVGQPGTSVEATFSTVTDGSASPIALTVPAGCPAATDVMAIELTPWTASTANASVVGVYIDDTAAGAAAVEQ